MTRGDSLLAVPGDNATQNVFVKAVYEAAARERQHQSSLSRSTPVIKLDDNVMSPAAPRFRVSGATSFRSRISSRIAEAPAAEAVEGAAAVEMY